MKCLSVFLLLAILGNTDSLKFLVYNPIWGRSHVTFMGKVAESLVDAGHNVTMLSPITESKMVGFGTDKVKNIITIPPCDVSIEFENTVLAEMSHNFWRSKSVSSLLNEVKKFVNAWAHQCNATINHPGLMEQLKLENFDAAISEPVDMCGFAIFHHIGIKNIASTLSVGSFEGSFDFTGLPSFPSYVPGGVVSFSEKMTFFQRMANVGALVIGKYLFPSLYGPMQAVLEENFGVGYPGIKELCAESSLFFLNSDPLIEFPRPTLHKIIDIGGISVSSGHKQLNQTWSDILNLRKQTVFISFGTVAKSYLMPEEYKESIKNMIRQFPDVTFIWKYEKPEHKISEGIENIVESTWVPQNDLLYDRRLSLFITHCGQGSTIEATTAGVPLIVIPVLGDQIRNAEVIRRIETGLVLDTTSLSNSEKLKGAVREILTNEKFEKKARLVGEMIRNRPFTAKELFVKNVEFMAKYGPLRQLDHYGSHLNFIQYYLIDVFAFLFSVVFIILFVTYKTIKFIVLGCLRVVKVKKE